MAEYILKPTNPATELRMWEYEPRQTDDRPPLTLDQVMNAVEELSRMIVEWDDDEETP